MSNMEWISRGKKVIMNTYNRFPLTLTEGKGVYVKDAEGKKYLDFASGIAVNALGYGNKALVEALEEQINKIMHCSNLYWNTAAIETAEIMINHSIFDKVFL